MFGNNPLRKREHDTTGDSLVLQGKSFVTIQGEGPFAGYPCTFVRLWGCHLACLWCDTDFESDPHAWSVQDLVEQCAFFKLVVITGGEPLRQNLLPFVQGLLQVDHLVQIETSGSFWIPKLEFYAGHKLQIVVSPKTHKVDKNVSNYASAWKYIVSARHAVSSYDGLPIADTQQPNSERHLARPPQGTAPERVFVQPMDEQSEEQNKKNLELCIRLAKTYGYRISLQQHKIMNVP